MNYNLISSSQTSYSALETVLRHRNLSDDEIYKFLNPSKDNTYSPYELANIKDAAKAIINALSNQEDMYIQVDSDCDGYTSSALLINYLYGIAPITVLNHVTYGLHSSKQHGIDMSSIKEKTKLVIIPDASSNEVKPHMLLHDRGIKVVVLDHHEFCPDDDPAIIVNNQFGGYPNRALSGVGIVYKLCQLIDEFLPVDERKADLELDLVAVGMIADMMDLRSAETKYLITEGLKNITNPFISTMRKKNEFVMKGIMSPFTVSFYIAPFVNAVTRVGTDAEKKILFESMLKHKAFQEILSTKRGCQGQLEFLVDQAVRMCGNVKKRQEDNKQSYLSSIINSIETNHLLDHPMLIIVLEEEEINTNLSGLLANQIMAEYRKPTLILTKRIEAETEKEIYSGSGRGFKTECVDNWKKFIADSGYAIFAEGHPFAFGVAFYPEDLENFIKFTHGILGDSGILETSYDVDFVFSKADAFDDVISELGEYKELWGQGVSEPLVVLKSYPVTKDQIQLMGRGTLKISLSNHMTSCIKFNFKEDEYNSLMSLFVSDSEPIALTILGTGSLNEWNGRITPQLMIKDFSVDLWYF